MTATAIDVLILGAGINGCAVARELVLNGLCVVVVDKFDISYGATSRSSRLIHGGLRYLEYGDFDLVRESLEERNRLLKLAAHEVRPLTLYIPVEQRFGGVLSSGLRFLGLSRVPWLQKFSVPVKSGRGLWLVRMGLWLYDRYSGKAGLANHRVLNTGTPGAPQVDPGKYPWLCAYTDAQINFPERFCISLLEDARRLSEEQKLFWAVHPHAEVTWTDGEAVIRHTTDGRTLQTVQPRLVINATGAWGDLTLQQQHVPAPQLFGGTKGSHLITWQPALVQALGPQAVYAEAGDGRLVFILPWLNGVMVGTTDERFELPPEQAIATEEEINYLLKMVNELFPQIHLTRRDVEMHYCGVRPLPHVAGGKTAAISRDHSQEWQERDGLPWVTLVGGKLTTCRAFAEQITARVTSRLGRPGGTTSGTRPLPGSDNYPSAAELETQLQTWAGELLVPIEQMRTCWNLLGTRTAELVRERLAAPSADGLEGVVTGTNFPRWLIGWMLQHEWCETLEDLVERRLMLLFHPRLQRNTLEDLADCLTAAGRLPHETRQQVVEELIQRLHRVYGKQVESGGKRV